MPDRIILFGPYRLRVNEDTGEAVIEEYDPSQKKWVTVFDFVNTARIVHKTVSVPVGANNTWGQTVSYTPRRSYLPYLISLKTGGTFATGEMVDVEIIFVFDDGSSKSYTKGFAGSGIVSYYYPDEILGIPTFTSVYNGKLLKRVDIHAKSNQATTQATITVELFGWDM